MSSISRRCQRKKVSGVTSAEISSGIFRLESCTLRVGTPSMRVVFRLPAIEVAARSRIIRDV